MSDLNRVWLELRLLSRRGVGIPSIAPELCRLIRKIVPSDAGAVAWLDDNGMPIGFFHEHQPPALKELFANHYEHLFMGPGEFGVAWMLGQRDRTIGNWLNAPNREVELSNTYNLYMRPLGHRHLIEARIEVDGKPRALFTFYREAHWPYTEEDVARFRLIEPLLQRAASPDEHVVWADTDQQDEYLVVNQAGTRLIALSPGAQQMLQEATLIGQNVSLIGALNEPPAFVRQLCLQCKAGEGTTIELAAAAGLLRASGRTLIGPEANGAAEPNILVTLSQHRPHNMTLLQRIIDLKLSPLRSEIVQYAVTGGRRADVPREFGISKEALKKHLAEVYQATGAHSWHEVAEALAR